MIEVVHPTRNRVYVRRFDHEEAARRLADGEKVVDLAREYGVTTNAIYLAIGRLDPETREKDNASNRAWRTTNCESCGGPAMKNIGGKREHNPDGRVLCVTCRGKERRKRFRLDADGVLIAVRCNMTDCANGERWQPPVSFAGGIQARDLRPRGFASECRSCNSRGRRERRRKGRP